MVAVDDDVFDDEVMVGEESADAIGGLTDSRVTGSIAGGGVEDDVGGEDFGDELKVVLVEALLVVATDDGFLRGGGHGGSLAMAGLGRRAASLRVNRGRAGKNEGEKGDGERFGSALHRSSPIQYMNNYRINDYTVGKVAAKMQKKTVKKRAVAKVPEKRVYESPARQRQADETRARIAAAARRLLEKNGYAGMTIPAVARAAGVAVPTVYAAFGSKKGIVSELLDAARFGEAYQSLLGEARKVTDPMELLRFPPRFARQIYEAEMPVENLLRGAGMVAPELAAVEDERNCQRYDSQLMVIDALEKAKLLKAGLTREKARAILWSLTSRELFRMLVRERGWSGDEYQAWLEDAIRRELVGE